MNAIKIFFLPLCILVNFVFSLHPSITILSYRGDGGGPAAVQQSLFAGLNKLNIAYNWNPPINEINECVLVLSNPDHLRNAITLKQQGKIKKLLAGPNIMNRATQYNHLLESPEIDYCIVASDWYRRVYESESNVLTGKIKVWPAGVNADTWFCPNKQKHTKNVLVYWKTDSSYFCDGVEQILRNNGWNPIRLVYGSFDQNGYKKVVEQCAFAVFISRSEGQGIALLECWSMDCPTLVWNPKETIIDGKRFQSSSCPYLTVYTGRDWNEFYEFENLLVNINSILSNTNPRKWVLENMTNEISAKLMLSIIDSLR